MSKKKWTEDEEVYLEYYLYGDPAEGERETNYNAAAEFLEVPIGKISKKAAKMRVKNKDIGHVRRPFTEREIEFIKRFYAKKPAEDIANYLGRLPGTVINKANNLGLTKRNKISDYDEQIRELAKKGHYRTEIARMLGLKKNSVIAYINRNGISCSHASKDVSQKHWREDEWKRHHIAKNYKM